MTTLGPQAATLANVSSSATSVTIFADTGRALGRAVFNDSTAVLYLAFDGSVASATNYTVQIAGGGYYEFPQPALSGKITGIWSSATGAARTTAW